jgi:outer membrane protease
MIKWLSACVSCYGLIFSILVIPQTQAETNAPALATVKPSAGISVVIVENGAHPRWMDAFPRFKASLSAGGGVLNGDVTYRIGREVVEGGERTELWFPLSQLKWPTDVAIASVDGKASFYRLEARGTYSFSVTDEAGKMQDSDWTYPLDTSLRTIYSESDATLDYWEGDGSVRYWVFLIGPPNQRLYIGFGAGYLHQNFDWEGDNVTQESVYGPPQHYDGLAIRYSAQIDMLYGEAVTEFKLGRVKINGRICYSPSLTASDEDDHVLRFKKQELDGDGYGILGDLTLRYDINAVLFVQAKGSYFTFTADGMAKTEFYAGEDAGYSAEIYEDIKSQQLRGTLALGAHF